MDDDDEFGDEIDWSTVDLPSIAASMRIGRPRAQQRLSPSSAAAAEAEAAVESTLANSISSTLHDRSVEQNQGQHRRAHSIQAGGVIQDDNFNAGGVWKSPMLPAPSISVASSPTTSEESLRKQIQALQQQLQKKDDIIFELEATAATAEAESNHRAQQAERDAHQRVRLAEEELRRLRMEADSYQSSLRRYKKRVTELEKLERGEGGNFAHSGKETERIEGVLQRGKRVESTLETVEASAPLASVTGAAFSPRVSMGESFNGITCSALKTPLTSPQMGADLTADGRTYVLSTPNNIERSKSGGAKRKMPQSYETPPNRKHDQHNEVSPSRPPSTLPTAMASLVYPPPNNKIIPNAGQHLAIHLLMRDEMGCYPTFSHQENGTSRPDSYRTLSPIASTTVASPSTPSVTVPTIKTRDRENIRKNSRGGGGETSQNSLAEKSMEQTEEKPLMTSDQGRMKSIDMLQSQIENEQSTKSTVLSVLREMGSASAEDLPSSRQAFISSKSPQRLSISGLLYMLLTNFNALFHPVFLETPSKPSDEDQSQPEGAKQSPEGTISFGCYSGSYLKVDDESLSSLPSFRNYESPSNASSTLNYVPLSWNSVLYLLHILNDVLILSGKARSDLRFWLYRSRNDAFGRGDNGKDDNGKDASPGVGIDKYRTRDEKQPRASSELDGNQPYSRIEGLPLDTLRHLDSDSNDIFWRTNCGPTSEQSQYLADWDPLIMVQPCSHFFQLLVGLMKGNVFDSAASEQCCTDSSIRNIQTNLILSIQIKAIELVLALMSDGYPYDHVECNDKNRTPYLWNFWFDSLLPVYSTPVSSVAASSRPSEFTPNDSPVRDFLSAWEINKIYQRLPGHGRQWITQLYKPFHNDDTTPNKNGERGSPNKLQRDSGKSKSHEKKINIKIQDHLIIDIKCKILQLLTHLIISSTSIHQRVYQVPGNPPLFRDDSSSANNIRTFSVSFARRTLATILDEMDEYIIPFLSPHHVSKSVLADLDRCLQLCHCCVQFLLLLAQSDQGIALVRLQMRLDSDSNSGFSRWGSSAIACVTNVLNCAISCTIKKEFVTHHEQPFESRVSPVWSAIIEGCLRFFEYLFYYVHNQRQQKMRFEKDDKKRSSKAWDVSLLSLVSEQRDMFQSCCNSIVLFETDKGTDMTVGGAFIDVSEDWKYVARMLLEEIIIDEEEDLLDERES